MDTNERFESFKRDLQTRLGAKVDKVVEILGESAWFELGILYATAGLHDIPDEVAAEKMADIIAEQFTF